MKTGYIASPPDHRDYIYGQLAGAAQALPSSFFYDRIPVNEQTIGDCHDKYTEVLTDKGWKLFSELDKTELIATVNPETNELIYVKPENYTAYRYTGDMVKFKHRSLDALVTPDHKMLIKNKFKGKYVDEFKFINAKDVKSGSLMTKINWNGLSEEFYTLRETNRKIPMKWWLGFLGLYIAEGTLVVSADWRIQIAAYKDREKQFAKECFENIGIHASEYEDRFFIHSKEICKELIYLGYENVKAHEKVVPDFVFNLSTELIDFFISGYCAGDGTIDNKGRRHFYTTSQTLANQVQHLLLLVGKWSFILEREPRSGGINSRGVQIVGKRKAYEVHEWLTNLMSVRSSYINKENYDDMVYCVEVRPYHTLVTRRNGKILIAGNCVGQSARAIKTIQERRNHPGRNYDFAPDFVYSECKKLDGKPDLEGTYPRTAMAVLKDTGAARKGYYPDLTVHNQRPTASTDAKTDAKQFTIGAYAKVQTLSEIKQALVNEGPVMAGFLVTDESVVNAPDGLVGLPNGSLVGGHAVAIDGYDDDMVRTIRGREYKGFFRFINSWSEKWGDKGYGWMAYDFVTFRGDFGMAFFSEAWSSVDVIMPNPNASEVVMWLNSTRALVDGEEVTLEQAPVSPNGRTLVPLRFLAEVLGWRVDWDAVSKKITLRRG